MAFFGERFGSFVRNDDGAELAEYALVLSAFVIIAIVAVETIGGTANNSVTTDENNFSGSLVNGY